MLSRHRLRIITASSISLVEKLTRCSRINILIYLCNQDVNFEKAYIKALHFNSQMVNYSSLTFSPINKKSTHSQLKNRKLVHCPTRWSKSQPCQSSFLATYQQGESLLFGRFFFNYCHNLCDSIKVICDSIKFYLSSEM